MRFLPFVTTYAGVLVAAVVMVPVPSEYVWAPMRWESPARYPECLEIGPIVGTGWVRFDGVIRLAHEDPHDALPMRFHVETRYPDLDWTPSRGDSFDVAGHHTLILRFPNAVGDTLVGRAYPPSYFNIVEALLARPMTAKAVRVECPRSGGAIH